MAVYPQDQLMIVLSHEPEINTNIFVVFSLLLKNKGLCRMVSDNDTISTCYYSSGNIDFCYYSSGNFLYFSFYLVQI